MPHRVTPQMVRRVRCFWMIKWIFILFYTD